MIAPSVLDLTCVGGLDRLLRVTRVAADSAANASYRHAAGTRTVRNGAIQITLGGCGAWWTRGGGQPLPLPPGTALYFHAESTPDIEYGYRDPSGQPWTFLYADLSGEAARGIIAALVAERGPSVQLGLGHPLIAALRRWLPRRSYEQRTVPVGEAVRLANSVLDAVVSAPASVDDEDRQLAVAAMAYLRKRLAEPVAVADVAHHLGVSREHLSRIFAAQVGEAPATWLRRQRVLAAAAALRGGDQAVSAIAAAYGFTTSAHFAALFRQHTGLTPLQYRRRGGLPGW